MLRADQGASAQELAVRAGINLSELNPRIPFITVDGGAYGYGLEDELPDAQPRLFNEANDDSLGSVRMESEVTKIYGKDVKTDTALIDRMGPRAHRQQLAMTIRAMRLRLERDVIRGDGAASNGREMDGLLKRLPTGSSQAIANHATAGPLKLSALDELLDAVDVPPDQKILIMGKTMARRLGSAVRDSALGSVDFRINEFGRQAMFYGEVPIVRTDVDNKNAAIQGFDEANSTTSIYCVAFGEGLVTGIQGRVNVPGGGQQEGLAIFDVGEMHVTPHFLTRIKWDINMVIENKRAAARLFNITDAAPIA